ncbi:MAG: hypothetical protein M3O62_01655 [Pseudomonadota bacterium]|nr:hypothetical protein [Pseudomonadota bacterium]
MELRVIIATSSVAGAVELKTGSFSASALGIAGFAIAQACMSGQSPSQHVQADGLFLTFTGSAICLWQGISAWASVLVITCSTTVGAISDIGISVAADTLSP